MVDIQSQLYSIRQTKGMQTDTGYYHYYKHLLKEYEKYQYSSTSMEGKSKLCLTG